MPRERKTELSASNVVLMLLVIFIHTAAECVSGYQTSSLPFLLVTPVHRAATFAVQGFLFLGGLKLALGFGPEFSFRRYARGRLLRVGLPYLIAFIVYYAVYAVIGRIAPSLPHALGEFFTGGLTGHFYYIAAFAQFCLLVPLWRLLADRAHPALLLFVSLAVTLIAMDHMPELVRLLTGSRVELTKNDRLFTTYLFYWTAGMTAGRHYGAFTAFLEKRRRSLLTLWFLSAVIDAALYIVIRQGVYYPIWADDFHLFTSTFAILSLLSLSLAAKDKSALRSPLFCAVDRASYLVYLWHPMVILFLDASLNQAGIASLTVRFLVRTILTAPISILLCVLWQKLVSGALTELRARKEGPSC